MNNNFKNSLFYPEFFTHQSIRLQNAPEANDNPDVGYMYVWYSYVNNKMFMNIKLNDGTIKNCPMFEQIQEKVTLVTPDLLQPTTFNYQDISSSVIENKKILVVNNNYVIGQINIFSNSLKQEKFSVICPVFSDGVSTYLDLTDVSQDFLQYGGQIVYSQGTVVNYGVQDNPYIIPSAQGIMNIDALNGVYQAIQSITDELIINVQNIKNLKDNQMLKIYINNSTESTVVVCGEYVSFEKCLVMFGCFDGNVYQIGKVVNISNGD